MNLSAINHAADNIRVLAASMVEKAKSGHPGGAMGGADFVNVLYSQFLVTDPDDGKWLGRDRFFLDPGHMSPMLYSVLALFGHYTLAELEQFRQWGSPTPGHPELHPERGVENTSGPLGQGPHNGCRLRHRRALHGRPLRRMDEPQDLCLYLRRRYSGRDLAGRRSSCRLSRPSQPHNVL